MSQNTINLLQAIGITLLVSAVAGGYQYYVQRLGNASAPPQAPAAKAAGAS